MGDLNVLFEVPEFIQVGLESGIFKRVGGVVVESGTSQVVAWLRDSGVVESIGGQTMKIASSGINPLNFVVLFAQTAASLLDGHATRSAVSAIGDQVAALAQQTQALGTLTMLTASGQVINLAFSAITFQIILKKMDALSSDIDKLGKEIKLQFEFNRDMDFKVALQAARDTYETEHTATRDVAMRSAVDGLYKAKETFLSDTKESLDKAKNDPKYLLIAQQQLIRAIYAVISRVRCYAIAGNTPMAQQRLKEDMPKFQELSELLIKAWLGEHPALYFHPLIESQQLDRFIQIERWLSGDSKNEAATLFAIVNAMRNDFWDENLDPERSNSPIPLFNRLMPRDSNVVVSSMISALNQCEIIIENMDRLRGFEIELRTLRLSLNEWDDLVSDEQLKEYGGAIIVDSEVEARYAKLAM